MVTHITVYATYYSTNILVYNTIILDVSFLGGFTHFTIVPFGRDNFYKIYLPQVNNTSYSLDAIKSTWVDFTTGLICLLGSTTGDLALYSGYHIS
jgi:hypothetical protein